ncbi:MAG: GAF domain-containing protein, partial [Chloroflexi bacterium]|nr:GAF domain-containing protein [Chloroflexota bacterium]
QTPFLDYLEEPAYLDDEKNASRALIALTRKNPIFIRSAAILNPNGVNVLDTLESNKGRDESAFLYFNRPMKNGLPFVSNIIFRGNTPSIYFSAPIKNVSGKTIGVLRVEYHAAIFQSVIQKLAQENPAAGVALVDITTYLRIADSGSRENLFKTYKNFTEDELVAMQSDGRLPLDPLRGASEQVVNGVNALEQQPIFYLYSEDNAATEVFAGKFLKTRPWAALVSQPTEIYRAAVRQQQRTNVLISIALVVLSVSAGFFVSQILTSPLAALTLTAEKVTAGDLNAEAQVRTEDEIGALAAAFNRMTFQLKQTLGGLEQRIAERTADLEISRQQSLKRANELQAIGEISKTIASEQKIEILLPLITRLVSERFGFYHTGIFLLDSTKQFAVLQAASSPGGKKMLARGHKLEVGGNSIVGYVVSRGIPRISLDVGQDAVYFNNPDLPTTRSEMTLPLKVRDQIVGALDVQSEKPGAFTQNDADTLSILADQVAISIENARLFAQTQQALDEVQTLYRQNVQEGWSLFSREREFIGYRQSQAGGKRLKKVFENDEIRQAVNRGATLVFHADGVTQEASIVSPIKLRGQIIGSINIKAPVMRRPWSNDETNLVETISERLSIALENARLIQESRLQAAKQQKISEITGKIGESINLKNVLQTAVEELGRALPGSEIALRIKGEEK